MRARSFAAALCLLATGAAAEPVYDVVYEGRILPSKKAASVQVRVVQSDGALKSLRFRIDPERHRDFQGGGALDVGPDTVTWKPPAGGGTLSYTFRIDHLRDEKTYDAWCATSWAIFRGDDLVPPAQATTRPGARSRARLRLQAPQGWSVVTRYGVAKEGSFELDAPGDRRFVRPTGWLVAGRGLGVVRERVAGTRVALAGPAGQGLRRLDILALLRWTLPSLSEVLGAPPERLLIVGAGDPMWRGGLSGPASLYVHASRPLITPDTTSPLLHELLHAVLPARAAPGSDWLVEGLAERYALELLVRSRTISRTRHERALSRLAEEGRAVSSLRTDRSAGGVTARAVTVLEALDREIRGATDGGRSLDDVVRAFATRPGKLSAERLRTEAERAAGRDLAAFFRKHGF